jgi:hypothetical protein
VSDRGDAASVSPVALATLAAEAGWPATERDDGGLLVELSVPAAYFAAAVSGDAAALRCTVPLAQIDDAPAVCRAALARLLRRVGEVVPLVHPLLDEHGARFEVALASGAATSVLDQALAALTVACRLFGREIEAVQRSPAVAAALAALADASAGAPVSIHPQTPNQKEDQPWQQQQ